MSRPLTIILATALLTMATAAQEVSTPTTPGDSVLKTTKEKTGYALGMEIGTGMRKQGIDIDPASVGRGFADAFSGGKTLMTEDEMRAVLKSAQEEFQKQQAALRAEKAQKELKEGEAFLEANKSKDGVITLPSGLQYKVLKTGDGKKPDADDAVVCNYRGTFIDGTEFDSSAKHNGPATVTMKGMIQGWVQALQMMPVGSKWQLFVPPQLAYGETGAGQVIPPNATLIFEVELLSIQDNKDQGKERDRE